MAETFKNVAVALGNSADAVVYTCPAATTSIVIHCQVANVDGTNTANANVDLYDSSTTTAAALAHTIAVPADTSLNPVGGKLVLEASDEVRAWASTTGDLEITLGILEITQEL